MIPLVEDYLSELIQQKIQMLRANPRLLRNILGTSEQRLEELAEYLAIKPVRVIKGYPRGQADLPCICILLSGEDESQMGLGDYIAEDDLDVRSTTNTYEVQSGTDQGVAVTHIRVDNVPLRSVSRIVNHTKGIVLDPDMYYIANEDLGLIYLLDPSEAEAGDEVEVTFSYAYMAIDGLETLYECNYRIESWTVNGDLTVDLYHLVKWALLSGRGSLIEKGLFRQKLGGADFEPATSWFPEFVYRRAMTFWCQVSASVPVEEVGYVTDVHVTEHLEIDLQGGLP